MYHLQISYSLGCLFVWLIVLFAVQKCFSLMWSHLFIFAFVALTLGDTSKKNTAKTEVKEFAAYIFFHEFWAELLPMQSRWRGNVNDGTPQVSTWCWAVPADPHLFGRDLGVSK